MAPSGRPIFREPRHQRFRRAGLPPFQAVTEIGVTSGASPCTVARFYLGMPIRWSVIKAIVAAAKRLNVPVPARVNLTRFGWIDTPQ